MTRWRAGRIPSRGRRQGRKGGKGWNGRKGKLAETNNTACPDRELRLRLRERQAARTEGLRWADRRRSRGQGFLVRRGRRSDPEGQPRRVSAARLLSDRSGLQRPGVAQR